MKPQRPSRPSSTASGTPALDADLADLIAGAIEPEPVDAATKARIKQKLLRRIAAETTERHLTLPEAGAGWQPFGDGLTIKVLFESAGVMSYLLRLAPGAGLPAHRHPIDEECVVIEGEVQIGSLRIGAGGFHLGRKDVLHDRLVSEHGALIYLRGAVPEAALAV
jgi:anti-sigma factor ChrR (cupin superfamily)